MGGRRVRSRALFVEARISCPTSIVARALGLASLIGVTACGPATPDDFTPWDPPAAQDPATDRLCVGTDDPEALADKQQLDCALRGGLYAPRPAAMVDTLDVLAFNIERGFQVDEILAAVESGDLPDADVWLLSEVDHGCARTDRRDVARDMAEALQLDFVYGVEFIELDWADDGTLADQCEHGNAILSRLPLGNVSHAFFDAQHAWYSGPDAVNPDEPRLGGRSFLQADLDVGDGQKVQVFATHLESTVSFLPDQHLQAEQLITAAATDRPVIAGGDLNTGFYMADLTSGTTWDKTTQAFLTSGFEDTHASLSPDVRATDGGMVLDVIFGRDTTASAPWVCPVSLCETLSDHEAIGATVGW